MFRVGWLAIAVLACRSAEIEGDVSDDLAAAGGVIGHPVQVALTCFAHAGGPGVAVTLAEADATFAHYDGAVAITCPTPSVMLPMTEEASCRAAASGQGYGCVP